MAKINLTPNKIYEQEFKTSMRGYDKTEVDEIGRASCRERV